MGKSNKPKKSKEVLLVGCDVYRPAAINQLQVVGEQIGVEVYAEVGNNNPVEISKNAIKHAKATLVELALVTDSKELHITITDNGCGFDEKNFSSFTTADSRFKESKGAKGVGRFIWLKAFF